MIIGITGTRDGLTFSQRRKLRELLTDCQATCEALLHGDCIGADDEAHDIAIELGIPVHIYPPQNPKFRAYKQGAVYVHQELPYRVRDKLIVAGCATLIGLPKTKHEELRSGTWATVRDARRAKRDHILVLPQGSLGGCTFSRG